LNWAIFLKDGVDETLLDRWRRGNGFAFIHHIEASFCREAFAAILTTTAGNRSD
jgi:hypothetical protein